MAAETMRIAIDVDVEDNTGPGFESAKKRVSAFGKVVEKTQSRLKKLTGSKWDITMDGIDKATQVINAVENRIKGMAGRAWNLTIGVIDKATAPLQGIFNLLRNPLLQAGAVLGISVSASDVISTFGGFESTMSQVKAISGASGEEFKNLTALAKEMGATTKFTAEEAAQGLTYMAMAGWGTKDMLTSLPGVMNLAAASGEDLATVSDIVTDSMTAFNVATDGYTKDGIANATHFSDVLAAASSSSNTNVAMMGETFKYVGSMAGALGYSIEDVALATGLMANSGIKGSMSGTALVSVLTRLSTNASGATDAINALGIEFYNSDGSARALGDVIGDLRRETVGMTAAQKSELANTVAGTEAQKGFLAILNASEKDYNKLTEAIYNADGAAQEMSGTMLNNLQGSLTLLGSAVDGVKLSLGSRLSPYVREFADWLTTKMPAVETVINNVMDTVDAKIKALKGTIAEFTSSDEWANADVWGKISIAWDKIVAEPFSQWWESSGKPWLTGKVAGFGATLGRGITAGLLAVLGFDTSGAIEDGAAIGASFIEGFKSGLDMDKISEAFTEWASDHKGTVAAAGIIAGGKFIGGIAKAFQHGKSIVGEITSLFGGGKTGGSGGLGDMLKSFTATTMTVTAGTVIVNGGGASNAANAARNVAQTAAGGGGTMALPGAAGTAGRLALPGASGGGQLALPGPAGGTAAAGGLTSAGSWLSKLLMAGSKSGVVGADGTLLAVQGGVGGTLGSVAGTLGSGATTAAGAAAVGAGSIAGAVGGILGLGSAAIDLFQGFGKQKEGDAKGAQDEFVTAGTKTGMVGAGAATGAAIGAAFGGVGAIPGALIGAGIGGIGALFGGDGLGKMLSDALDEGGAINTVWQNLKTGAGDAWEAVKAGAASVGGFVSEKWSDIKEGAASIGAAVSDKWNQASETVSEKWGELSSWFGENVWTPISDAGISAINIATGAWISITDPIKEKFGELSAWFGENVWEPIKTGAQEAGQWVSDRWTEAKAWASETWQTFSGWFEESVWTPVKEGARAAGEWVGNKWAEAKQFASDIWQAFSGWFEESVWAPVKEGARAAGEWVGNKWSEAKTAISEGWQTFSGWFDESVWTPVKEGAKAAGDWIGSKLEDAKNGIQTAWTGVSSWFGANVWGPIKSAASDAWSFVKEKWQGAKDWVAGFGDVGSQATGLTTSQGESTVLAHASGGIMTQPHMGLVAEDGPEAIIPLGASSRSRGMAVWEEAGDILGVNSAAQVGSNDSSLWDAVPVGNAGSYSGPQSGGNGDDVPVYSASAPGRTGPAEASQGAPVSVPVSITLSQENNIHAANESSAEEVAQILKDRIRGMVDDISDEMAEKLARIFANMPVKGGA